MKVKELISELQKFDSELEVLAWNEVHNDISEIKNLEDECITNERGIFHYLYLNLKPME